MVVTSCLNVVTASSYCRASMINMLLSGRTLLVDRYSFSGVAYSAAKGLDLEWCKV